MPYKYSETRKAYWKTYYPEHKEEIQQKRREYRQTEEYKEKRKQYESENKERISAHNNEKFNCECGGCYTRKNKLAHERNSKSHIYWTLTGIRADMLGWESDWHEELNTLLNPSTENPL